MKDKKKTSKKYVQKINQFMIFKDGDPKKGFRESSKCLDPVLNKDGTTNKEFLNSIKKKK